MKFMDKSVWGEKMPLIKVLLYLICYTELDVMCVIDREIGNEEIIY